MGEENNKNKEKQKDTEKKVDFYGILGKKIGMTRIFGENGNSLSVTVIKAGPCLVTDIITEQRNGYQAVQLGFEDISEKKIKKPQRIYFKKNKLKPKKLIAEFKVNFNDKKSSEINIGEEIKVDIFNKNDVINVTGISKGKGFQGGVKRWGWSLGPLSHGSRSYRAPGSIGASADPARVFKGKHLPGQMGAKKTTVKNLKIIDVNAEENILLLKGNVPGSNGGYLVLQKSNKGIEK